MPRIEIDKNKPLNPGDVIELHFKSVGMAWLKATQIAIIDWRLKDRKEFDILSWQIPTNTSVIFKVRVKKTNPIPVVVTVAIIAGIIVGASALIGGIAWLTLDKAVQIIETPAGKIGFAGLGISLAAAGAVALLALLPKK